MPWNEIVRILRRARTDTPLVVPPGFFMRTKQRLLNGSLPESASLNDVGRNAAGGEGMLESRERPSPSPSD